MRNMFHSTQHANTMASRLILKKRMFSEIVLFFLSLLKQNPLWNAFFYIFRCYSKLISIVQERKISQFPPKIEHHDSRLCCLQSWFYITMCKFHTHTDSSFALHSKQPRHLLKNTTLFMRKRSWLLGLQHAYITAMECKTRIQGTFAYQEARTRDPEVLPFILQPPCCELSGAVPHAHPQTARVWIMTRIMLPSSSGGSKSQSMFTRCFWVPI